LFDLWDQAQLTDEIMRPSAGRSELAVEDRPFFGAQIAPLKTHLGRTAKIRVREIKPFGKGQFRAPEATPPFVEFGVTWKEELIELVLQDEMHRINEEEWMKLNSSDENIRRSAGVDLVERGRMMQTRNERLTEWMRWQAFSGMLTVQYQDGDKYLVDYGLPATHKVTAGTLWSNTAAAQPIQDLQTWAQLIADDTGYYGQIAHMTSKTWWQIVLNDNVKNQINFYAAGANSILRPRESDILAELSSYTGDFSIVRYDNGFRDVGTVGQYGPGSLTKYLPDGYVLLTTPYVLDGTNIADVLDGQVSVSTGYNSTDIRTGFQSEIMLDHMSKTYYLRAASARIPRLLYPEAFVWAKVL
jgi:hypothetical protein